MAEIVWGKWEDYPKAMRHGKEVALINGRYHTYHAVEHFIPSFLNSGVGRGISPTYVEEVIRYGEIVEKRSDTVTYKYGSLKVAVDPDDGTVVTMMDCG